MVCLFSKKEDNCKDQYKPKVNVTFIDDDDDDDDDDDGNNNFTIHLMITIITITTTRPRKIGNIMIIMIL